MAEGIVARALRLLNRTRLKDLAEVNSRDYVRWQSIKRGRARMGVEELGRLGELYPQYRWWLWTGEGLLSVGQMSFDEASDRR